MNGNPKHHGTALVDLSGLQDDTINSGAKQFQKKKIVKKLVGNFYAGRLLQTC